MRQVVQLGHRTGIQLRLGKNPGTFVRFGEFLGFLDLLRQLLGGAGVDFLRQLLIGAFLRKRFLHSVSRSFL